MESYFREYIKTLETEMLTEEKFAKRAMALIMICLCYLHSSAPVIDIQ